MVNKHHTRTNLITCAYAFVSILANANAHPRTLAVNQEMKTSGFGIFTTAISLKKSLVTIALLITSNTIAQHLENPVKALHDKKEFIFGIDNRITRINNEFGIIYGLYSGIGYGNNMRFKFSISGTPFSFGKVSPDREANRISRLLFASIGQEFDFFTFGRFKVATYLNAGFGYHYYRMLDPEKTEISNNRDFIRPLELGIHGRYQINPLFAFKVGGGWRFVFPEESEDLEGYYIKLTAVVNPKNLRATLKERRKRKERNENGEL